MLCLRKIPPPSQVLKYLNARNYLEAIGSYQGFGAEISLWGRADYLQRSCLINNWNYDW